MHVSAGGLRRRVIPQADVGEPGWSALQGLAGWTWLAAIAGFAAAFTARRRTGTAIPRPAPARQPQWQRTAGYANQAVLPFYLLHEPVIVAFAWIIVRWHAPILVKYPALVAASFTATLVIYELAVRRYRITRLLFGMKIRQRPVGGRPLQTGAAEGDVSRLPEWTNTSSSPGPIASRSRTASLKRHQTRAVNCSPPDRCTTPGSWTRVRSGPVW
jgi:hypothetical protein